MNVNNEITNLLKNQNFRFYFKLYFSIFIVSFILSIMAGLNYSNLSNFSIYFVKNYTSFRVRFSDFDIISILVNNLISSLSQMYIFYSLESGKFKKFLGIFYHWYMGSIGGLVISKVIIKYNLIIALSGILPHGIIEIPTAIFAISCGAALSELKHSENRKTKILLVYISIILFLVLGLSAYIETYITPNIFNFLISYYHGK